MRRSRCQQRVIVAQWRSSNHMQQGIEKACPITSTARAFTLEMSLAGERWVSPGRHAWPVHGSQRLFAVAVLVWDARCLWAVAVNHVWNGVNTVGRAAN